MGLDARLVSFAFVLSVCFGLFLFFCCRKNQLIIILLQPEENMG